MLLNKSLNKNTKEIYSKLDKPKSKKNKSKNLKLFINLYSSRVKQIDLQTKFNIFKVCY